MQMKKSEENNKKLEKKECLELDLHPKMTHILTEHG